MKTFAIVYQCSLANVFDVTPIRCKHCLDVPGRNGLGKPCRACKGTGNAPEERRKRLWQGSFADCEQFMRGAVAAGVTPRIFRCDEAGDVASHRWEAGIGSMFAEDKSIA